MKNTINIDGMEKIYLTKITEVQIEDTINKYIINPSARPEVRETADVDSGAYLPFPPLPRTPSRLSSFRSTDGRTGTNRTCD